MNTMLRRTLLVLALATSLHALDLRTATIVAGPQDRKVATMLQQEIEKRPRLTLPIAERAAGPAITISGRPTIPAVAGPEGYRLQVVNNTVHLAGNDRRGTLFAAGALLRHLHMDRDTLDIPDDLKLATAPKYPLRGHQLGYRPKTNSYDGWDVAQWEQYIRDLAVFGTNAIELIPPRSGTTRTARTSRSPRCA